MLTKIEEKTVYKISNNIIDTCLDKYPEEAVVCVKHRANQTHIIDALSHLPKDHPARKELSKISEIANDIKEETIKWAILRGVIAE